jgi:hypothetical protein
MRGVGEKSLTERGRREGREPDGCILPSTDTCNTADLILILSI